MFLMRLLKDGVVFQKLLRLGEETDILIICMRLQEFVPCQTISNKSGLVGIGNVRCLLIDGIVPAKEGIVNHTHMARTIGEQVVLA